MVALDIRPEVLMNEQSSKMVIHLKLGNYETNLGKVMSKIYKFQNTSYICSLCSMILSVLRRMASRCIFQMTGSSRMPEDMFICG